MTANVLEFRRARAFADAVDAREARFDEEPGEGQYDHMLAMVTTLATVSGPSLDPQVRLTQRALLVAEFERAYAGGGGATVPAQRSRRGSHRAGRPAALWPSTRWGRRLAVGGLASMMALGTLGGVAVAATSSLPGDSLYGMKRGLEDWRLNLAGSDEERGKLLLDEASTRMDEARRLMGRGTPVGPRRLSPQTIADLDRALSDMNAEGKRGRDLLNEIYRRSHSLAPLQQLAGFAAVQSRAMDQLEPELPGQLDPVASQVRGLLSGIRQEVTPLLPAQPGAGSGSDPSGSPSPSTSVGAPTGSTTSGTGTMQSGASPSSAPSGQTTSGTGNLVGGSGLGSVGGLLGGASPSTAPSATPSASPSGSGGSSLTIPPLVGGLLPGIGIGVSGG
ncbi:DUF5667 domain-containing protein [Streptacidiphilus melanogenes]|uniref:DUF5667 domain-containing protein n=1 Tax=Streptacidiphilus melanogenes TaxID=411235 RepID=UPI0005A95149|nr:DUF5667 domain-containing protein [Streptacidiphilus melanogenes]